MRHSKRTNHNAVIHRKLSEILVRESKDPRFHKLTISRVEASSDLSFAKVFFSIFPAEAIEELEASLNHAAGFFSWTLGKSLKTRNTPRLVFIYDEGFEHSVRVNELLSQVDSGNKDG